MNNADVLPAAQSERRTNAQLRKIFPDVVSCIAPFYGPEAVAMGGSLDYWAARAIQDRFPELDALEVRTLLNAAARVHLSGGSYAET